MRYDQARFTALVNAYSGDLYRFAYWLGGNRTDAEDLVQETFARAWRSLGQLRDDKAAKGWLFTTLRREHARQFERLRPTFENVNLDQVADPRRDFDDRVEGHAVRIALLQLPIAYREPLLLQVLGGYSGEEIALMLGLTVNAVAIKLFRARQMLCRQLTGEPHKEEVCNELPTIQTRLSN